ncbi:Exo-beta-D-glucosaminidase, partial [termite gut metagenome]
MEGDDIYLQLNLNNYNVPIDKIVLKGSVTFDASKPRGHE